MMRYSIVQARQTGTGSAVTQRNQRRRHSATGHSVSRRARTGWWTLRAGVVGLGIWFSVTVGGLLLALLISLAAVIITGNEPRWPLLPSSLSARLGAIWFLWMLVSVVVFSVGMLTEGELSDEF